MTADLSDVRHPEHYQSESGLECWDAMELIYGADAVRTFCRLNVMKIPLEVREERRSRERAQEDRRVCQARRRDPDRRRQTSLRHPLSAEVQESTQDDDG